MRKLNPPICSLFLTLALTLLVGCQSQSKQTDQTTQTTTSITLTPPAELNPANLVRKIAFGSCAHQKKPEPIFKVIEDNQPDLYIGAGDNVYSSKPEDKPISEAYRLQSRVPEYNSLREKVPMLATWDDHDYGLNDGGKENPEKEVAKNLFLQHFPNDAKFISTHQAGVYHSVILGPSHSQVQVILLDTRSYRDSLEKNPHPKHPLDIYQPTQDKTKSFLGEEQWKWLEDELKKAVDLRIIVSSVQLIPDDHSFEKWGLFPHERTRLLNLIQSLKKQNTLVISGDRHLGEISQIKLSPKHTLTEITASGINRTSTLADEKNRYRLGSNYLKENFGLIEIDWRSRKLIASLKNLSNETVQKVEFKF